MSSQDGMGSGILLGSVLPMIASALGLAVYASNWGLIQTIQAKKDTGVLSHVPFIALLCNSGSWIIYGLTPDVANVSIVFTNLVGFALTAYFLSIFYRWSTDQLIVGRHLMYSALFLSALATYVVIAVYQVGGGGSTQHVSLQVGIIASLICVIMFGSPLSTIALVLRTRSTESMPVAMSVLGFLCAVSWFSYGLVLGDPFVIWPNGGGALLGTLQLGLLLTLPRTASPSTAPVGDAIV